MLLVDADQAEPRDRREDGRARADDDPAPRRARSARARRAARRRDSARVQDRDRVAEARADAADGLRRERDLRHEHDRAEPALERRLDRLEVDLGLAGAGGAVEEQVRRPPLVEGGDDPGERGLLLAAQLGRPSLARERLRARPAAAARRAASPCRGRPARAPDPASSRSSRRARARGRRAARGTRRRRARPATSRPRRAPRSSSAVTTPRARWRPSRTETTEPLPTPSAASYVNGRASARVVTSG